MSNVRFCLASSCREKHAPWTGFRRLRDPISATSSRGVDMMEDSHAFNMIDVLIMYPMRYSTNDVEHTPPSSGYTRIDHRLWRRWSRFGAGIHWCATNGLDQTLFSLLHLFTLLSHISLFFLLNKIYIWPFCVCWVIDIQLRGAFPGTLIQLVERHTLTSQFSHARR